MKTIVLLLALVATAALARHIDETDAAARGQVTP